MDFEVLDSLSLPGDPAKANDDAFACEGRAAVVLDGATGLGEPLLPGPSDAAWIARYGAERLMAHMRSTGRPADALRAALEDAQAEFARLRMRIPIETYEIPFASMMFLTLGNNELQVRWFGDCAALVRSPDGTVQVLGEALQKRARERERVAGLAAKLGSNAAATGVRKVFLPALRRMRNFVNTEAGGWLFGPDARASEHAAHRVVPSPRGSVILLVSDGFLALASDYERYSIDSLLDAALAKGLAALGEELRAIEGSDPEGIRFPRFKKSDDATALLLRVV